MAHHGHMYYHRSLHIGGIAKRHHWLTPSRVEGRAPDTVKVAARSATTCVKSDNMDTCQKPQDSTSDSLPMILGIVIPIIACLIVCFFLHQKYLKRQRREDNDKHKSLDFGMEVSRLAKKGRKGQQKAPEMSYRQGKGMSLDVDMHSPYILPEALRGSRESLHSLSRSMKDEYDPYRPVVMAAESIRAPSRLREDGSSIRTGNTAFSASSHNTDAKASLVRNASPMAHSRPTLAPEDALSIHGSSLSPPLKPAAHLGGSSELSRTPSKATSIAPPPPPASDKPAAVAQRQKEDEQAMATHNNLNTDENLKAERSATPPTTESTAFPPRGASNQNASSTTQPLARKPVPAKQEASVPAINLPDKSTDDWGAHDEYQEDYYDYDYDYEYNNSDERDHGGLSVQQPDVSHRLSMSVRPLPPDEPNEDAETRANRIRSFYKEYFDESKPNPSDMKMPALPGHADYHEDYDNEYLADGAIFDPETGQFIVAGAHPHAEPVTRRAMTPPPRAPPRFRGNANGSRMHSPNLSIHSTGTFAPPPRGHSAMSHRGYNRGPKRPLEPPKPLKSIPTPHLLKDDTNLIFDATDFAPPASYRDRQAGRRPDSPFGVQRPYSPSVRAHTPLQGSYDDLSVMPSPHMLRKSSTFTALDFAPPTRFRGYDNGSDAASMRSGRSGLSQAQAYNIRAGAYRVSRIPRALAGTKDEITASLRPTMNMALPA